MNVDLAHLDAPGKLPGDAVDDRRQLGTRDSTRAPEIDQHGLVAERDLFFPIVARQFQNIASGHEDHLS